MKKARDVRRPGARSSTSTDAAAPLSSTIPPRKLQCFSVACLDMPALEFGDKIVLPANVLMELQCFKIPTPMLFHIRAFGHEDSASNTDSWTQYCSVQEFSAPSGQVFIPYWMMQNLHISEGQDVLLTSVLSLPRGVYCRLQPEDSAFLAVAAEIGPKLLLESALRRYSVLSEHETILIIYGEQRFYVRVVELKPARVVSILGDVDLTVDFTTPERADPRRPKSSHRPAPDSNQYSQEAPQAPVPTPEPISQLPIARSVTGCGRRLGDGVSVPEATTIAQPGQRNPPKLGTASFQAAQQRMHQQKHDLGVDVSVVAGRADTEGLATHIKQAQAAFTSFGNRLGGKQATTPEERPEAIEAVHAADQSSTIECSMCLAEISSANIELHTVRCAKNPSYHKVACSLCQDKILKTRQHEHIHCPQCLLVVDSDATLQEHTQNQHSATHKCDDCAKLFTRSELEEHRQQCLHVHELCTLCGFKFKRKDRSTHLQACRSRTERCEMCKKFIKLSDLDSHVIACCSDRGLSPNQDNPHSSMSNQHEEMNASALIECPYCTKRSFLDQKTLDRHVNQECGVARSFRAPIATQSQLKSERSDVRAFVQGKIKRREDLHALPNPSTTRFDASLLASRMIKPTASTKDHSSPLVYPSANVSTAKRKPKHVTRPVVLDALPRQPSAPTLFPVDAAATMTIGGRSMHASHHKQPSHRRLAHLNVTNAHQPPSS